MICIHRYRLREVISFVTMSAGYTSFQNNCCAVYTEVSAGSVID